MNSFVIDRDLAVTQTLGCQDVVWCFIIKNTYANNFEIVKRNVRLLQ